MQQNDYALLTDELFYFTDRDLLYASKVKISNSVRSVDRVISNMWSNLEYLMVDETHPSLSSIDGVLFDKKRETLLWYPPQKKDRCFEIPDSVRYLGNHCFRCNQHLERINGGRNIVSILGDDVFGLSYNLRDIGILSGSYKSVEGVLFTGDGKTIVACPPHRSVDFFQCTAEYIHSNAFCGNKATVDIVFSDKLLQIESAAFLGCESLKSITTGFGLKKIGIGAFAGCSNLEIVVLQDGIQEIDIGAFNNCRRLEELLIPDSVRYIGFARDYSTISKKTTILCSRGSCAERYAIEHGIKYTNI